MRILVISSYLPYPLFSGGSVRLYNILRFLSKQHKITLICEKRKGQTAHDISELKAFCESVIVVDRKKQWSWQNILKTAVSPYPFLFTGHMHSQMRKEIVRVLREKTFDLIHVETSYVMQNLPKTYLPIVLVEHNVEYLVYKKYVDKMPFILRPLLNVDILKLKQIEQKQWQAATSLVAVSDSDKKVMQKVCPDVSLVPNGVNIQQFSFVSARQKALRKTKRILFIGDYAWIQNKDAVQFIMDHIWPAFLALYSDQEKKKVQLWIVGKHMPSVWHEQKQETILFDEKAPEETEKIFQKADILLAPIRVGGGSSYKIIEAMATGTVVVTTDLGAKGLGLLHRKEACIAETPEAFAKAMHELLTDTKLYESLAERARKKVETEYAWETIVQKLEKVYQKARE